MPSHAPPHIRSGLVSITFRALSPEEVVSWAARAGLRGIEWGGDIHVPHGDVAEARRVAGLTRDAGLDVAAYGSYYRLGDDDASLFPRVLETAVALGARIIRVWAGRSGSAETDPSSRALIERDGMRISELAAGAGLTIATEWHGGTLTDTAESAAGLFKAVPHPAFRTYWQPRTRLSAEQSLQDLQTALPRLAGVHVFQWDPVSGERLPLSEGEADWERYLAALSGPLSSDVLVACNLERTEGTDDSQHCEGVTAVAQLPPPNTEESDISGIPLRNGEGPREGLKPTEGRAQSLFALLEFVKDDDPQQMLQDAATLNRWLANLAGRQQKML